LNFFSSSRSDPGRATSSKILTSWIERRSPDAMISRPCSSITGWIATSRNAGSMWRVNESRGS
jgi:hypothetical protein